jgi:TolB-like protein/Flp pilus assembly protein TadD
MNRDEESEFLSDGISEDIIIALGKIKGLRVTPRATAFHFKGQHAEIGQVAEKLKVGWILTGSVRRAGNRLRISVELIDAVKESQIWSERYDRVMEDIFAVQDEISRAIASALEMKLAGSCGARHTCNAEAYELYLRGRHHWSKRTEGDLLKAIEYLEKSIVLDPKYALAHAALADCYPVLCHMSYRPGIELWPKAKAGALRACALDEGLAEAHVSMGFLKGCAPDFDWAGSEKEFLRATELDPVCSQAFDWHALMLAAQGRFDEATAQLRRAFELDPLSLVLHHHAGWVYNQARQYDYAIDVCRRAIELDPHFPLVRLWLAMAYCETGRHDDAVAQCRAAVELAPAVGSRLYLARIYAASRAREEARRLLEETRAECAGGYIDPYLLAVVHAGLGETERAFELLEQAWRDQSLWLSTWGKCDPWLDPLRGDARFANLLARMKLA